jgi:ATP synthase protein I
MYAKLIQSEHSEWQSNILISATHSQLKRPSIQNVIVTQLFTTFFCTVLACFLSVVHGYSAFLGGLICTLPNAYFAYRSFVYQGAHAAEQIIKGFYKAEAVKLTLTALLFGLTFKFVRPLEPLTLFITFFLVQVVLWFTPLLLSKHWR